MTKSHKFRLLALSAIPWIGYGYLTCVYFLLIDRSSRPDDLSSEIAITAAAFLAFGLSVYISIRIMRGGVRPGLRILDLIGIHCRIFSGCLIAYLAVSLAESSFVDRWTEQSNAAGGFGPGRLIEAPVSLVVALFLILCAVWLGKIAWDMLKEIPKVLAEQAPGTQESGSFPLAE